VVQGGETVRLLGRLVGALLLTMATLLGVATSAWGYWTTVGAGSGTAVTGALDAPTAVLASTEHGTSSVEVTWAAPAAGVAPEHYTVTRVAVFDGTEVPACGGEEITTTSCTDLAVPEGVYEYVVTAVLATWTAHSVPSPIVTVAVDSIAPAVTVTTINGSAASFPASIRVPITSIGGTCGTAPGDVAIVVPLLDAAPTNPDTAACLGGTWTLTLATPLATDGTYALAASQSDSAGNVGTSPARTVRVDLSAPTLLSLTRAGASPTNSGPLVWTATFSEAVAGLGPANFGLALNGITGTASITSVSAPTPPAATWTVTVGTAGATGSETSTIGLNLVSPAGIADVAGNALATASATGPAYVYDTTRPALWSISRAGPAAVNTGPLAWTLTFSSPVKGLVAGHLALNATGLSGTPTITSVTPVGGSPAATWTATVPMAGITAAAGTVRLDVTSTGGITDAAGNPLSTTSLTGEAYTYDTVAPTVVAVSSPLGNGSYRAGQVVPVTVTLSEVVTVDTSAGTPAITLATGTPSATPAVLTSGTGSTTLTFTYTVAAGNTAADLDYVSAASLLGNGATIRDAASNPATLTLPVPGASGSLGAGKDLVIDTTAPLVAVTRVNGTARTFPYHTRSNVTSIGGTCGTAQGDSTTVRPLINGAATNPATATCSGGAWNLTLATRLSSQGTRTLSATQADAAGNTGTAPNQTLVIDTTRPTVTGVSSPLPDGSYRAGQVIPVVVTFNEPVLVTGTPVLRLVTGTPATTDINYTSGSGTAALTFTYTVAAGNTSPDLNYQRTNSLAVPGATIRDAATNSAVRTLPGLTATTSLAGSKNLVIDTTAPTVAVTSVNGSPRTFPYSTTATITSIGGTCGTASGDSPTVRPLINGAATVAATATCSGGTWTLVLTTPLSASGSYAVSATQADAAGNTGTATARTITKQP
jgi:hypothetical protein